MRSFAVAVLSLAVAAAFAGPAAAPQITVPQEAAVGTDQFTLGEIAQITAPDAVKSQLAAIGLGMSPRPGLRRTFTRGQLETRLRQHGFDPKKLALTAPDTMVITRASQEVPADALVQAGRDRLREQIGADADAYTVSQMPRPLAIAPGDFKLETEPLVNRSGSLYSVTVRVRQADRTAGVYRLQFRDPGKQVTSGVRPGEMVQVTAGGDGVSVTAAGEARTAGTIGETISVFLPGTRKTVKARLYGDHLAKLEE